MDFYKKLEKYSDKIKQNPDSQKYKLKFLHYHNLIGGFTIVPIQYINGLKTFIEEYNSQVTDPKKIIDPSHGLEHALVVLCHTEKALQSYLEKLPEDFHISEQELLNVRLAALLHDIDDSKYFPDNHYQNARLILSKAGLDPENIESVIKMISWVSSSANGDTIPPEVSSTNKIFMLFPRYADRLEAIGIIGLQRTLEYNKHKGRPLCIPKEPNPGVTIDYIYENIATPERYQAYSGNSATMIDHLYDKLLRLGIYPIKNDYFDEECASRQGPLKAIAVLYETQGNITEEQINDYIRDNPRVGTVCQCDRDVPNFMTENGL